MSGNKLPEGPEDQRPKCFAAALKGYSPGEQLLWIFESQNPEDWMKPPPPASLLRQPQSLLASYVNSVPEQKGADPPQVNLYAVRLVVPTKWKGPSQSDQSSTSGWQGKSNWQNSNSSSPSLNSASQRSTWGSGA
eukprot:6046520-Amphidinium_carterae.2